MKLNRSIALTVLSGISLAGLLAGCYPLAPKDNMIKRTTEYNLVAEETGNQMLFLNIIRASKRRPMYFTSFGKLTGNITYEFETGSMTIPFGGIGHEWNGTYSVAPKAAYKSSPLFDMAVLDTKEFTCGIMKPVPMTTIEYYRSQGWPKDLLWHVFIRRIDVPGEVPYENDPEDWKRLKRFENEIQKWDIVPDPNSNATKIGTVDATQAARLKNLIEVQKAGFTLKESKTEKGKWDLWSNQAKYVFRRSEKVLPSDTKISIRSPEAILYYLGEILRVEMRTPAGEDLNVPKVHSDSERPPAPPAWLFYACKAKGKVRAPWASVDYEGDTYVIPGHADTDKGECTDRSMHVLSLVSQLIGQQKSSTELPATGVVNVIGR